MNKCFFAVILLSSLLFANGCTTSKHVETGYAESAIHDDFPIPEAAKQGEITTNSANPNIKIGVSYELDNIGGEQGLYPPESYFQKLDDAGWAELEDRRMGHVQFFEKEDTVIAIEIHEDTFQLYEMKPGASF
ncbi:hypothetical protein NST99_21670 [Paenibacillus sp. FSL L8-0470]|uniref:hypothetical protein n=1 Tax=unclassified Paenibacillus TaxID=185978 RepID=UPI0030FAC0AA